jgi:hypothetical protein
MNHLSREKQIEVIAALCEGVGQYPKFGAVRI